MAFLKNGRALVKHSTKPAQVLGYMFSKRKTPRLVEIKKKTEPANVPQNIFDARASRRIQTPRSVTTRNELHVSQNSECGAMNRSLATITISGTVKARPGVRVTPEKNAMAVTGVKFSGCGRSRRATPATTKMSAIFCSNELSDLNNMRLIIEKTCVKVYGKVMLGLHEKP